MPDTPERSETAGDPIVAAAMRGDREAQRALWEQHRRWVAAVLLAHKPAFEDLDDLLQEVAVTFITKVHTVRVEAHLRAWLRMVAVNTARAAARSGKYRPKLGMDGDDRIGTTRSVQDARAGADQAQRMLDRIERLPDGYREPLMLRVVQGMKSKQIGELLGVPPATVDTRVARARRMLREGAEEAALTTVAAQTPTDESGPIPFRAMVRGES